MQTTSATDTSESLRRELRKVVRTFSEVVEGKNENVVLTPQLRELGRRWGGSVR